MSHIRVAVIGTRGELAYLMRSLDKSDECTLVGVITQADSGQSVADIDGVNELETCITDSLNTQTTKQFLEKENIDLCVCLGWYEIIEPEVLELPKHGIIGIHAAPLPSGRGQAPVNWQLIEGRDRATATVFGFSEGVDAGPIYGKRSVRILEDESVDSVYDRLMYFAIDELTTIVGDIARGDANPRTQSLTNATYWPSRGPEDGLIDWRQSATKLDRFVRALADPYPSAYTYLNGQRLEIVEATVAQITSGKAPGEIVAVNEPTDLAVQTGDGVLSVRRVACNGSPRLTGSEFAVEQGLTTGDTLGINSDFPTEFTYTGLRGPGGETDLLPETNVSVGEVVSNLAYCFCPRTEREISLKASVNGEHLLEKTVLADGHTSVPVEFQPEEEGEHYLRVQFSTGDTRTMYVYVHT
jgi:methionyl-tRNA formyltransferase